MSSFNLDYLTLSYQIEDHSLCQKYSTEYLKLSELSTKNLKLICESIVPINQTDGVTIYL
ncbi:hypothetical protein AX14_011285 [Amanita brunnescens Koide BX004]|nr:hypothetical protein AX14_011285 [Amanita brunnescens Koide BX004]